MILTLQRHSTPPYTHNLTLLAEKSGIYNKMTDKQKDFLDFLEPLNIEARYPAEKEKLLAVLYNLRSTIAYELPASLTNT